MSKKQKWLVGMIAFLFVAAVALCIWKLNLKINTVHDAVMQMQQEGKKVSLLPDMSPHGAGYKITQFGAADGAQMMFYAITTEDKLVLIDGGYGNQEELLKALIAQYDNQVEAWILTHPHEDHITAFMNLYESMDQLEIQHVYAPQMPDVELMQRNASWDNYATVERFNELPLTPEYLHVGDTLDVCGMTITVLSAYDDYVDNLSNDLLNDGSLMFRISGQKESMLFCADVGICLSELLMNQYGESLKCDYIQMGHHGFGGLSEDFYHMAAPKGAFFDAPAELLFSDNERSAQPKVTLMEDAGVVLYTYLTAPNQVILK